MSRIFIFQQNKTRKKKNFRVKVSGKIRENFFIRGCFWLFNMIEFGINFFLNYK